MYGRYEDEDREYRNRGQGWRESRGGAHRPEESWDRNSDGSLRSYQRTDEKAQSFGYGDDFAGGRHFAGPYETNRDYNERWSFHPMGGHYASPVSNFGGASYGGYDRSEPRDSPRSSNLYGSIGDRNYSDPGRVDYGLRGGTDYSSGNRERFYGGDRNREEEGFWASAKRFFGKGPKGWRRSDERIHEEVCEALTRSPVIDASDMEVSVKDAVVTLKGTAESRFIKRRVEDLVDDISGVEDVKNELQIRKTGMGASPGQEGSSLQTGSEGDKKAATNRQIQ